MSDQEEWSAQDRAIALDMIMQAILYQMRDPMRLQSFAFTAPPVSGANLSWSVWAEAGRIIERRVLAGDDRMGPILEGLQRIEKKLDGRVTW